mmetsp:Transcript_117585/g.293177  ORF Transcript_117585/g.293177 Transcript_117585/m.293177 type:complete len:153 (+) Transcript_117585:91-549(+)|eukprot:CAMPEP_0115274520 /NCGR_PEP_ID=MMETSP0270-20121206/55717_1 /TAXON_ID=71861 /ORGANISM="Scrippsiella trochoidea, Strain CCMP3099" /LENGTH=152 /DNA_ID=CAMNT_0002691033 /DNA_START=85 /DNA_END=543 /DNA_ORIENTATION=+
MPLTSTRPGLAGKLARDSDEFEEVLNQLEVRQAWNDDPGLERPRTTGSSASATKAIGAVGARLQDVSKVISMSDPVGIARNTISTTAIVVSGASTRVDEFTGEAASMSETISTCSTSSRKLGQRIENKLSDWEKTVSSWKKKKSATKELIVT